MALTPNDLFGVALDWDRHADVDVGYWCGELLELLNVARPDEVTAESHSEFMRVASPLMSALPEGVHSAIDLFMKREFSWPWTGHVDEQHEELPGAAYHQYLLLRQSSSTAEYQERWDMLLDIMEDFREWASR